MVKKGDTLIEVTLAIGIFSMVAIAVVSVMNGGVSKSETALETTLTREEIDTQADALRFIHDAYMAGNQTIGSLWNTITQEDNLGTSPTDSCDSLDGTNAFFLDVSKLFDSEQVNDVYQKIKYTGDESKDNYKPANDYPQINESKAEGIYIIGKAASQEAQVFDGTDFKKGSIYYDFRIQTCWYGVGEDISSTISTVVRLNNPVFAKITGNTTPSSGGSGGNGGSGGGGETPSVTYTISFDKNGGTGSMNDVRREENAEYTIPDSNFTPPSGKVFNGWKDGRGTSYTVGQKISITDNLTLYAQWKDKEVTPTPDPDPTPDPGSTTIAMTSITQSIVNGLADGTNVTLTYGGKEYSGKKYNGRIWMMESITTDTVYYTSASSECPTNWGLPIKSEVEKMSDGTIFTNDYSWTDTTGYAFRIDSILRINRVTKAYTRCVYPST